METQHIGGSATELHDLLLHTEDLTDYLQEFTATIASRLSTHGDPVWCAVTVLRHRKPTTVASSSPEAEALDETQNRFPAGPCLTATSEHTVVRVGDVRDDPRWADYHAVATGQGVRSVLGVPFELGDEGLAGLNVYSAQPHDFPPETIEGVRHEVALASQALRLAVRLATHRETATDLGAAMDSRTTINLAVGIIMGQNRCSQQQGFEILKAASSHRNRKLREVAADLVATVGRAPASTHFDT